MLRDPRLDPRDRSIIDAISARIGRGGFIRPPGNPARITLGLAVVVGGGVEMIEPDGRPRVLVRGLSPWIWPAIVAAVGVLFVGIVAISLMNERGLIPLLVVGFLSLLFGAITVGAFVAGKIKGREKLVFDPRGRVCHELSGGRTVLTIPARLMQTTRVQVQSSSGYADVFNVLVDLGFAELWIHQTSEPNARALAGAIATYMGIPFDPKLERRPGD